jgi:ParB family chromosome partitioning protein
MESSKLDHVSIIKVQPNKVALRPAKTDDDSFVELLNSVRTKGVMKPILVSDNGDGTYTLIDGLQRFTAAQIVMKESPTRNTIPVHIVKADTEEQLVLQILLNNNSVKTRPVEYASGIQRILTADPSLTQSDLAEKLCISLPTLQNFLRLKNLADPIKELVDSNKLKVTNAYVLAKLDNHEEQMAFLEDAISESPEAFVPKITERIKELKKINAGNKEAATGPALRTRRMPEVRDRYYQAAKELEANPNDPVAQGFCQAIAWVLHQDEESVKKWKEETAEREMKKAKEAEATAKKKSEEAQKLADAARAKMASITN